MAGGHRTLNLIAGTGYLALVILAVWYSRGRDQQRLHAELALQQMMTTNQIQGTLAISVESLKGLAAHVALRPELSQRDFQRVAEQHWRNKPGLAAIEWQPLVPDRQRARLEAVVREQGGSLSGFHLWEPGPGGRPIPARPRPLHVPVLYVDSPGLQVRSTGLDLAFSPARMDRKWQAADSGLPQASKPARLIVSPQGTLGPVGLVVTLPVYQQGVMPEEPAERRRQVVGFLALLFNMQSLLAPQLKALAAEGVVLQVRSQGQELVPPPALKVVSQPVRSFSRLDVYGQRLDLVLEATPQFVRQHRHNFSQLLIGSVTVFGGLLLAMLWQQQRINRRLEATQGQLISTVEELQQTQQELEAKRVQLRLKLRTSITASAVAHEVNQPLSTMRLLGQRMIDLLERGSSTSAELLTLLGQLMRESDLVVSTTEKMRMLLRNAHTERQPLDLAAIVEGTLLYLRRLLQEHKVEVSREGLAQAVWIDGDGQQLRLAISNVVRNAVEVLARQPEGQRRILVRLRRQADEVQLVVADNGAGFPEDLLALNTSEDVLLRSRKPFGSGIGLYVVSTTMENHGGRLELGRSDELGGAEVVLCLPARAPSGSG